ncbi:MAG: hypothetical protein JKY48_17170 [Flavobacteriales bacterium]|nr:hypothetical protein [Flavobacteriales bacterium]
MPFNNPNTNSTIIQGIRGDLNSKDVYISGTFTTSNDSITHGVVYKGPLSDSGNLGTWYQLDYTSTQFNDVTLTSCYGPNNATEGNIRVVGAYKRVSTGNRNLGFLYEGSINGSGKWTTIRPSGVKKQEIYDVFMHSTMGSLAVGNYDLKNEPTSGFSFIYNLETQTDFTYMVENSYTTSLYGIWYNGNNNYTLSGGFTTLELGELSQAFLVDYNASTKQFTHFKAFNYNNDPKSSIITHFEGITGTFDNGYNMPVDWLTADSLELGASQVRVNRNPDGSFTEAIWNNISYPESVITSANTAYKNNILGIYVSKDTITNTQTTSSFNTTLKK